MAKLVYTSNVSLDGYIEDADGSFDWFEPDEEYMRLINDLERPIGTYLYGRRLYETMVVWETLEPDDAATRDYGQIWRAAEKVVYSRTLEAPSSERTRIEGDFDAGAVRRMKESAASDLSVGGAELAAEAIRLGLVDEVRLFVSPVVFGGGKPVLPDGVRWDLELLDERRLRSGVVHLRYGAA